MNTITTALFVATFATLLISSVFTANCQECCTLDIAESIPYGLNSTLQTALYTHDAWLSLINGSAETLDIACFYMTLNDTDGMLVPPGYGHSKGVDVYNALIAASKRGVKIRVAMSEPSEDMNSTDAFRLAAMGVIELRLVNMTKFFGGGVLHTKFIVADKTKFYVGSANLDWRSLTQVKELGIVVTCDCLGQDMYQMFSVYWEMAALDSLPSPWPARFNALFNMSSPARVDLNGEHTSAFISSAPLQVAATYRTYDLDALESVVNNAEKNISIEVMDYFPTTLYSNPVLFPNRIYWPDIDDVLRAAAFNREVTVRLLISQWNYTIPDMYSHLQSIQTLDNVHVKLFKVPVYKEYIPYTRVNHAKYMVTEKQAFITTSNWSGDYFLDTCGASFITNQSKVIAELQEKFLRDWNSEYAVDLPQCPHYPPK